MEELKERYFSIEKCRLEKRGEVNDQLVKKPFNYNYEVRRKINLEKIFLRTTEHQLAERQILEEVKKNEQRIKKAEREQKNLARLMSKEELPDTEMDPYRKAPKSSQNIFTFDGSANYENADKKAGVYLRSQLMNAALPIPEQAQKKLDQILKELAIQERITPTAKVVEWYDNLRKETLTFLGLEKHIKKKLK